MSGHPAWTEVSLSRLRENFNAVRGLVGADTQIISIIKANAYGHGALEVARALQAEGARWFGVASTAEGVALRDAGISGRVLLLGGFWRGDEEEIAVRELTPVVFTLEQLEQLENAGIRHGRRVPFHVKVDTGMSRLGLRGGEFNSFLDQLDASPHVMLEGLCTHLASADENPESTAAQLRLFEEARCEALRRGYDPPLLHAANSAAMALFPEARGTAVRPGIALYGYQACETPLDVAPVLSLKSRVIAVRNVPTGAAVGYGGTWIAERPSIIATVSAGYADGVNRLLSNRGRALVRGLSARIAGRVSMDYTMLDVTSIPAVERGDEVVFIGCQGSGFISATEVAALCNTLPYEILCNVGARVPRLYAS